MNPQKVLQWIVGAASVLLLLVGCAAPATKPAASPAVELYRDQNGYFGALPPEGWKQKDFPSETIRSKVEFYHPKENQVNIRIISGPVSAQHTLDDLYKENQQKIDDYFRTNYPNGVFTMTKGEMGEYQAIIQRNSIPGLLEQEIVMTVNKGLAYSIAFSAPTKTQFDSYYPTFQKFLQSFIILETGKIFTDEEIQATLVAKYKRLAELHEQAGLIEEALQYVEMGLSLDPNNAELIAMKERLQSKQK